MIARTGYTGEDGFEIVIPAAIAPDAWKTLAANGFRPAGLGARDTLRLEAAMNLYGQHMDEKVSPLDAGLAWTVDLKSPRTFVGKAGLESRARQNGIVWLAPGARAGIVAAPLTAETHKGNAQIRT